MDNLAALAARDAWLSVAASWPALQDLLIPASSPTAGSRPRPASRPPLDVGISDLLGEIRWWARFYAQVLAEETDDFTPSDTDTPSLLREVVARYGHFAGPDSDERLAVDWCDQGHELARRVHGAILRPGRARWLGPCLEPECDGELRQRYGHIDARCGECGRTFESQAWREHLEAAFESRLMTRSELVSALVVMGVEVRPKTLDKWVERRRLVAVEDGLYRFAEALDLAEQSTRRVADVRRVA